MNAKSSRRFKRNDLTWLWFLIFGLFLSGCITPVLAAYPPPATPVPSASSPRCTIEWAWQDGRLVLTMVHPHWKDGLAVGDVVLAINGQNALNAIESAEILFSNISNPTQRRGLALNYLLTANQTLRLQVQHLGQSPYFLHLKPDCR